MKLRIGGGGFAITEQDVRLLLKVENVLATHGSGRETGYVNLFFDDGYEQTVRTDELRFFLA